MLIGIQICTIPDQQVITVNTFNLQLNIIHFHLFSLFVLNFYGNSYLIDVGYIVRQYQIRMEAMAALDIASKFRQNSSRSSLYSLSQFGLVA